MSDAPQLVSTKLIVHELEKMGRFYCGVFGFEQTGRVQADIADEAIDEILLGREGGAGLILMKYLERAEPPTGEVALVFMADDLDALFERVTAEGGGVHVAPYQSDVTPFRVGFCTDPEGHLMEVIERPKRG